MTLFSLFYKYVLRASLKMLHEVFYSFLKNDFYSIFTILIFYNNFNFH